MSLETWKAEFYPTPAEVISDPVEAIEHSILKWTGLLDDNLRKHAVRKTWQAVQLEDVSNYGKFFRVSSSTCALCSLFLNSGFSDDDNDEHDDDNDEHDDDCPACPLVKAGYLSCLRCSSDASENAFEHWALTGDAEPMLEALETALARWKEQAQVKETADADNA